MEIINAPRKDLTNETTILVLGILSLAFCWCYGFIGLILGIIAVALANTQRRIYLEHPDEYREASYKNVNAGRICGIIAICISSFILLMLIMFFCLVAFTAPTFNNAL